MVQAAKIIGTRIATTGLFALMMAFAEAMTEKAKAMTEKAKIYFICFVKRLLVLFKKAVKIILLSLVV